MTGLVKRVGHCSLCDTQVYDVKQWRTHDDPDIARHPARVGRARPEAQMVRIGLSDGSYVELTFCEACAPRVPDALEEVWQTCIRTQRFFHDRRADFKIRPMNDKQRAIHEAELLRWEGMHLTGVMGTDVDG